MKQPLLLLAILLPLIAHTQSFKDCNVQGSTTIYDGFQQKWIYSDSADAQVTSLPASTFKVINLLIAIQTGVIKNGNEVVKWPGHTDTTLYGYRPEIYRDISVKSPIPALDNAGKRLH
jgi:beta-lactamase class D